MSYKVKLACGNVPLVSHKMCLTLVVAVYRLLVRQRMQSTAPRGRTFILETRLDSCEILGSEMRGCRSKPALMDI